MSQPQPSTPSPAKARLLEKHDDDIVIVSAVRTAITKARKGAFAQTRPEELLSFVLRAAYEGVGLDPALIEDVAVGNVLPPMGGATQARMAALHAGLPSTSSIQTLNRQCSSGLSAVALIANAIRVGQIQFGIGAGVESMTFGYGPGAASTGYSEAVLTTQEAEDCLVPMGITSENVAAEYGVSREEQDAFAARSFQRAAKAQGEGRFGGEILPVRVKVTDPKTEKEVEIRVDRDDGVREGVTKESLGKLKAAFREGGTTHAGNASQVSDGAAAVLLTRRSLALKHNLPILGKYVQSAVVGVPPRIMGVGPLYAIPRVLGMVGLTTSDVDFYEINEAFASQAVYCVRELGLDEEKVNQWGGAIALGHPLGCTGARQIATGLNIARQTGPKGPKVFVTSMCIGSGMGMAGVFVSEQ